MHLRLFRHDPIFRAVNTGFECLNFGAQSSAESGDKPRITVLLLNFKAATSSSVYDHMNLAILNLVLQYCNNLL